MIQFRDDLIYLQKKADLNNLEHRTIFLYVTKWFINIIIADVYRFFSTHHIYLTP